MSLSLRITLSAALLTVAACGTSATQTEAPITLAPPVAEEPAAHAAQEPATQEPATQEPAAQDPATQEPSALPPTMRHELAIGDAPCETDADCAPVECCHPSACGAAADAPTCTDVMCTEDCQSGTMDCGGQCLCHEGRCAAQLLVVNI